VVIISLLTKGVAAVAMGGVATGATLVGLHHHAERTDCSRPSIDQRAQTWLALPDGLRADIQQAVDEPAGQRRDDLLKIRDDALAGKYGTAVQQQAKQRQQRLRECLAG
jgi:hypothetical protein